MNDVMQKIETKLDKSISDLESLNDNKLIKIIDDLDDKTIIITHDIMRMFKQLNCINKKQE